MGNLLHLIETGWITGYLHHTGIQGATVLYHGIGPVGNTRSIQQIDIGVDFRFDRTNGHAPDALVVFLHRERFEKKPSEYAVLLRRPMKAANSPLEKEANAFAAHLLVPRKLLDKYVGFASVDRLAEIFAVSKDVIRARLEYEYGTDA